MILLFFRCFSMSGVVGLDETSAPTVQNVCCFFFFFFSLSRLVFLPRFKRPRAVQAMRWGTRSSPPEGFSRVAPRGWIPPLASVPHVEPFFVLIFCLYGITGLCTSHTLISPKTIIGLLFLDLWSIIYISRFMVPCISRQR